MGTPVSVTVDNIESDIVGSSPAVAEDIGVSHGQWATPSTSRSSFGALFRILSDDDMKTHVSGGAAVAPVSDTVVEDSTANDRTGTPPPEEPQTTLHESSGEVAPETEGKGSHGRGAQSPGQEEEQSSASGPAAAAARAASSSGRLFPSSRPVESNARQLNSAFVEGLRKGH